MPLPLLPLIIGGASIIAGAAGVKKGVDAVNDNKKAADVNEKANDIVRDAKNRANIAREESKEAIDRLGEAKIEILDEQIMPFIEVYDTIHHIELSDTPGTDELKKFRIDKQGMIDLRKMGEMASSLAGGVAGGAVAGAITAFGAYSGVALLGAASTGTAIAGLSGVAATNATLAFLGGGALSAGGLGIAGGTAVLGGLVAGPALAVLGFAMSSKASANLDNAYSNLSKAREFEEEMETVITLCNGIEERADLFSELLERLSYMFMPMVNGIHNIVESTGTDYRSFSQDQKKALAVALSTAGAIKAVLDTPILTQDGKLTDESRRLPDKIEQVISARPEVDFTSMSASDAGEERENPSAVYYTQAFECFRRSAEQGNVDAQYSLGFMYREGVGVAKDKREAARWLLKAADQGHEAAAQLLDE